MHYENNVFVDNARNKKRLRGHILFHVVFVHNDSEIWTKEDQRGFLAGLEEVTSLLKKEATAEGVPLQFSIKTSELKCNISDADRPMELETLLIKANRCETAANFTESLKAAFAADNLSMIYVWKRGHGIWECSRPSIGSIYVGERSKASILLHEILHLYGAEDLYFQPAIKDLAEYCFPETVMNCPGSVIGSQSIDPLTRFLIGWRKQPSSVAAFFLDQTMDISSEQLASAKRVKSNTLETIFWTSNPFFNVEELQRAAVVKKDPWALFLVGHCHQHAIYLPRDFQRAEKLYKESYIGACAPAGFALAELILSRKEDLTQNDKATVHQILYTLQRNPCHILAVVLYACCLYTGVGFVKNDLEYALSVAISNYDNFGFSNNFDGKSRFRKMPEVIQQLKLLEKLSQGLPALHASVKRISEEYALIEKKGSSVLRFLMGQFLSDGGTHPRPNPRRSLEYFLEAAQAGLSIACDAVANCYSNGIGTQRDPVAAQLWKDQAVKASIKEENNPERLAIRILNQSLGRKHAYY